MTWFDLRYAIRQLRQNRGFTIVALLALALGIGANSAIFTAFEAVLLRPLPYSDPDRLVIVWEDASTLGFARNTPAPGNYAEWRKQNDIFTDIAATRSRRLNFTGDGVPEQVLGRAVTPNFFNVLGVQPKYGRPFTAAEDAAGTKVIVISDQLWHRRYGADLSIIGRFILVDGAQTQVIGVMAPNFFFPDRESQFWIPASFSSEDLQNRHSHFLTVVARLKPHATFQMAQQEMNTIAKRLATEYPDTNTSIGAVVVPIQSEFVGDSKIGLWMLLGASAVVLLIACSNLANLLLVRAAGRRREIAVRLALGAGRKEIIRQMMIESLLLSFAGGALGLIVGRLSWGLLEHLLPPRLMGMQFTMNPFVLLFTLAVSV
ncbi:MAG: ABC transporter permease, partial [Acidobacteria bacterium]